LPRPFLRAGEKALQVSTRCAQESRMPFAYWVHDLSPFLVRFSDTLGIRYYGLAYLAGFAAAAWLLLIYQRRQRSPFGLNEISDLMTYVVFGVLIGGRLGYFLLYQTSSMRTDPFALLRVWEGGMASHGGFIGVLLALMVWSRQKKVPVFEVTDLIVASAPLGLFFGRIANFINGELVGKVTSVPWAVIFPQNESDRGLAAPLPRHPSQLYQAGLEGLLLFAFIQWRFWRRGAPRPAGALSGEFLIAYAFARILGERFREPDASLILGLSRGTFYSGFFIVAGAALIASAHRTRPSSLHPSASK
jgi:phosphatidylglycerol:prolipoprotein diacylglycerol transferase